MSPVRYSILYADPPWDYKGQKQHAGKGKTNTGGAERHYPTMTLEQLKKLDVPSICEDDCLLFMWTSSPHFDQAIELMKAWGFAWATVAFVWNKVKVNPGFYTMSQVELCVVGKRGKIPQPRGARNRRQYLKKERTKHSEKPPIVMRRIDKMFPTQWKLELFARTLPEGVARDETWAVWGNGVESAVRIAWKK
jgi:N6-adenosine-specific RNA methylase IME4